jgi:hypothetical protein
LTNAFSSSELQPLSETTRATTFVDALNASEFDRWTPRWTPKQKNGVKPDNNSPEIAG